MFQSNKRSPVLSDPGAIFTRGPGGILPERGSSAQRDLVTSLLQGGMRGAQQSQSPLLAMMAPLAGGAIMNRTNDLYAEAQKERDAKAMDIILAAMGGGGTPVAASPVMTASPSPSTSARNAAMAATGGPTNAAASMLKNGGHPTVSTSGAAPTDIRQGIIETAHALGMPPEYLATYISYETAGTFDPTKKGPTTQWGQHEGLIQFGQPQQAKYGYDRNNPIASQLGANGAVAKYFRENGWQPGMSFEDGYSIINAGAPGLGNRTDANNGGAPGTVAQKAAAMRTNGHRANALRLLGGDFNTYANVGRSPSMSQDNMRALMGLMTNSEVSSELRDLASTMLGQGMQGSAPMSPQDQIGLAGDLLSLEDAMRGPQNEGFRPATPEEAAAYGATAGQIGPDNRFYPVRPDTEPKPETTYRPATPEEAAAYGVEAGQFDSAGRFYPTAKENSNQTGEAGILRQRNEATSILAGAIENEMLLGLSPEEARAQVAANPIYRAQLDILGISPDDFANGRVSPSNAPTSTAPPPPAGFTEDFK